jgi:hypothetical protein
VFQDNIWKPDIALKNSNKDYTTLGIPTLNVEVSNDGTVEWYPFEVTYLFNIFKGSI